MAIDRREFLKISSTLIASASFPKFAISKNKFKPIRFGIITDLHYANRSPHLGMNRYYAESCDKLKECVGIMNEQKVDFLIQLGDLKDQGNPPNENETIQFLEVIEDEFRRFNGPRYHVLGNHDHDSISKQQFLKRVSIEGFTSPSSYYAFDKNSFHFVVMDANYTSEGKEYNRGNFDWKDSHVPFKQLEWLKEDLTRNKNPTILFIHHRLDPPYDQQHLGPNNAFAIREILEKSGNVFIVFQGHDHGGDLQKINNINYYTLKAAVEGSGPENNNYAIVEIDEDLTVQIKGYRKTISQNLV